MPVCLESFLQTSDKCLYPNGLLLRTPVKKYWEL
jgi:hypothetical protein